MCNSINPRAYRVYPKDCIVEVEKAKLEKLASLSYQTHTNFLASFLHAYNERVFFAPFYSFIHCKAYRLQPCPGENKEYSNFYKKFKKTGAYIGCAITAIPAFPSLLLGLLIRFFEHGWRPFLSYLKNVDIEDLKVIQIREKPLHLGCLNVGLTPSSINIEMDLRPPRIRAEEIAASLLEDSNRPEILFIEEGWNEGALKILCNRLKAVYPYIIHSVAPHLLGMSSGIAVFSMYPLDQIQYTRFKNMVPPHNLPPRGILRVGLKTDQEELLYLYGGVHAQAFDGVAYSQARLYQMQQLIDVLKKDADKHPHCFQVVLGDLNTSVVDMYGYDNRNQAEKEVLQLLHASFEDPFLKDHDLETGRRINGKPYFLSLDNARMRLDLPEPQGSWYDGPFTAREEMAHNLNRLDQESRKHGFPARSQISGKELTESFSWGTSRWFQEQSAKRPRYDYALFPKHNNKLDGIVELRRLVSGAHVQSPPTVHLLLSLIIWPEAQ